MTKPHSPLDRRNFLKMSAACGTTLLLSTHHQFSLAKNSIINQHTTNEKDFLLKYSPIDRTLGDSAEAKFYGDANTRPHQILWNVDDYLKEKKVEGPIEEVPLVIVGGGPAGLFTAYTQRKHKPVVLEQAERFGGNAKGQSWRGMDYALGSAYIDKPHPGTPMDHYFKELNLDEILVERKLSDPVEYKGNFYQDFWEGETDQTAKNSYTLVQNFLKNLASEKDGSFPLVPSLHANHLASVKHYDQYTLHELLTEVAKNHLPTQLETALEYYCWSTYAASSKEISAASALNFLAQEGNSIFVGAGGNAKIVERVLTRLVKTVPASNLRTSSIVVKVKVNENHVDIFYEDKEQKLRQIRAKSCVLSCPKFVAAKILDGIESERLASIQKIEYRSYLTANLLVKKRMKRSPYDVFMIGDGKTNLQDIKNAHEKMNATDFVMGNFAAGNKDFNVLTFYNAIPYSGARMELIAANSYDVQKKRFEQQINDSILPMMQLTQNDVVDLRLARFGHALPLAKKGFYQDNTVENLRKPFRERVFFVEQDNWAYPSLQTGATDAWTLKPEIQRMLTV